MKTKQFIINCLMLPPSYLLDIKLISGRNFKLKTVGLICCNVVSKGSNSN